MIVTHQLSLSKHKQSISPGATVAANPSFGNFVGSAVKKMLWNDEKKFIAIMWWNCNNNEI